MIRIIVNAVGYNIGWLACVLAAREGSPLLALPVVGLILALHFAGIARQRRAELFTVIAVTAIGTAVDSGMAIFNIINLPGERGMSLLFLFWIGAFWANFALLLNTSLTWLRRRLWLAAILGAVGGPAAYLAAAKLGGADLYEPVSVSLIVLAIEWLVLLPVVVKVSAVLHPDAAADSKEPARESSA